MTPAPPLTTERLTLRAPVAADFAPYCAFMLSERSHMRDPSRRKAWHVFATEIVGWSLHGFGHWVIERGGAAIGFVGFSQPAYYPEPELGWTLYNARDEGHGFATEAARAARDWAKGRLAALVSYVAPTAARSIAVAERLGAMRDPAAALPDDATPQTCAVYRHWGRA